MKQKKKSRPRRNPVLLLVLLVLLCFVFPRLNRLFGELRVRRLALVETPAWVEVQLIPVDGESRRGEQLRDIQNIVIHYVGNPGTTAQQNHDWYCNPESRVSSHFLVGLEGEIIQCVPLDEYSSASNHRNGDTISIEVCHPDDSGRFSDATYTSLVRLTAWLVDVCHLDTDDVIRHYDITGKECPRYYVRNEDSWHAFLEAVDKAVKEIQAP